MRTLFVSEKNFPFRKSDAADSVVVTLVKWGQSGKRGQIRKLICDAKATQLRRWYVTRPSWSCIRYTLCAEPEGGT
jgi:hypothetical protein